MKRSESKAMARNAADRRKADAIRWLHDSSRKIVIDPVRCPNVIGAFKGEYCYRRYKPKTDAGVAMDYAAEAARKSRRWRNDPDEPISSQICRYALEGLRYQYGMDFGSKPSETVKVKVSGGKATVMA